MPGASVNPARRSFLKPTCSQWSHFSALLKTMGGGNYQVQRWEKKKIMHLAFVIHCIKYHSLVSKCNLSQFSHPQPTFSDVRVNCHHQVKTNQHNWMRFWTGAKCVFPPQSHANETAKTESDGHNPPRSFTCKPPRLGWKWLSGQAGISKVKYIRRVLVSWSLRHYRLRTHPRWLPALSQPA